LFLFSLYSGVYYDPFMAAQQAAQLQAASSLQINPVSTYHMSVESRAIGRKY